MLSTSTCLCIDETHLRKTRKKTCYVRHRWRVNAIAFKLPREEALKVPYYAEPEGCRCHGKIRKSMSFTTSYTSTRTSFLTIQTTPRQVEQELSVHQQSGTEILMSHPKEACLEARDGPKGQLGSHVRLLYASHNPRRNFNI